MTEKTENELKLILKECEERFTSVYKEKNLSFEEQELVRSLFFENITTEDQAVCINRLKRFRNQTQSLPSLKVNDQLDEIEKSEDLELEKCFICSKKHTIEHYKEKGNYQGKYGYDEPFPSYYICYCEPCNNEYQALKKKAIDTSYKFEKQLLSKIRKAIKRNCKTLSILKGDTSVWDVKISPIIKNHEYRCFNEEELNTLVKFKIFDSIEHKTSSAQIEDMYYFYLTRKDLIEVESKTKTKTVKTNNNGLIIKVKKSGELACFIPRKVFSALYNSQIITKQGSKWIVDLTKKDQIKMPLEVVG